MLVTITNKHLLRAISQVRVSENDEMKYCLVGQAIGGLYPNFCFLTESNIHYGERELLPVSGTVEKLVRMFDAKKYKELRAMLPLRVEFPDIKTV